MAGAPPPKMSAPLEGPSSSPKRKTPIGLILGVLALGGCGCAVVLFAAVLFPVFAQARKAAQSNACMRNLRQLGSSVSLYATDFDGHFPAPKNWMDELSNIGARPRALHCPSVGGFRGALYGFAFSKDLAGKKESEVSPTHELIFDSSMLGRNASSGLETLPSPGRHGFGAGAMNHILLVDGSVETRRH